MTTKKTAKRSPAKTQAPKPSAPRPAEPPSCPAEDLVALYVERMGDFRLWMRHVRDAFEDVAPKHVQDAIHSVRGRLKDPTHLLDKIPRKRAEGKKKFTLDTFFNDVTDLAGVRVLTLFRWDLKEIDEFIRTPRVWHLVEGPIVYAGTDEDAAQLKKLGFKPKRLKDKRYTSIHYVVSAAPKSPIKCEIQVRGLHIEGWAEVNHKLKYPDTDPGNLVSTILDNLHNATIVTDWLALLARRAADGEKLREAEKCALEKLREDERSKVVKLEGRVAALQAAYDEAKKKGDEHVPVEAVKGFLDLSQSYFGSGVQLPLAGAELVWFANPAFPVTLDDRPIQCERCNGPLDTSLIRKAPCTTCKMHLCPTCFEKGREGFQIMPNDCGQCQNTFGG